jgi:hypothetical protein
VFPIHCIVTLSMILFLVVPAQGSPHQNVWLRNEQGDKITTALNSIDPYSPKKTCGACHDYSAVTSGYHFQQGFDAMKDRYDARRPWILSPGMFGNWLPTAAAGRLAAKVNTDRRDIDLSTYDWIGAGKVNARQKINSSSCGSCHPGGGPLEYGRDAQGRADLTKTLIQAEAAGKNLLDGDFSSHFTPDKKSRFRQSGVVEADCLICHMSGYDLTQRNEQLYRRNYRWAATAGAGLGEVKGSVFSYSNPAAGPDHPEYSSGIWNLDQRPVVSYRWSDRNLFMPDGRLQGRLVSNSIPAKNCLACHAEGEAKNTGTSFALENDVHMQAGMMCTDCHGLTGKTKALRLTHQIAKGKSPTNSVRDGLDGVGMKTCIGCHEGTPYRQAGSGRLKQARNPRETHARLFPGASFHTYLISCNGCHSTAQPLSAMIVLDMSSGREYGYTVDNMDGVAWPSDYSRKAAKPWSPWLSREKKYRAAVPKVIQWFGEKMAGDEIKPIPLSYVRRAAQSMTAPTTIEVRLPEGKKERRRTIVSNRDIAEMIRALTRAGFRNVVYLSDQIYELKNDKLAALPLKKETLYYLIDHSVIDPAKKSTYGSRGRPEGCVQCHDDKAPFFTKMEIRNVRGFLQDDYPVMKEPNSPPQYEIWGLKSVPAFE